MIILNKVIWISKSVFIASKSCYLYLKHIYNYLTLYFFFQAEDGIRDYKVTGVQTCALPISKCRGAACCKCRGAACCAPTTPVERRHRSTPPLVEPSVDYVCGMKLVLFDIDGTLLWTDGAGRRAIQRALVDEAGTPGPLESHRLPGKTHPPILPD